MIAVSGIGAPRRRIGGAGFWEACEASARATGRADHRRDGAKVSKIFDAVKRKSKIFDEVGFALVLDGLPPRVNVQPQ
jgi:hypothetical protein